MTAPDWRPFEKVDYARLRDARLQAHHAVQWLARAARAYVPAKPDDSHTSLFWDEGFNGFATYKMQGARLGLKLFPLSFVILEGKEALPTRFLGIDGHKEADLRVWLGEELGAFDLDARALDKPPPYRVPPHKVEENSPYLSAGMDEIFRELAAWFSNADRSIGRVAEAMRSNRFEVSLTRCWPHHFDIAALIAVDPPGETLESARTIGIGLSPGDRHYDEPYFYVSPWPYPAPAKLPPVPPLGRWHIKDFTAAILPAHRILAAQARQSETETFLAEAVVAALTALKSLR
jgi:hypothetical protein